jgi:hypothetical protein
LLWQSLTTGRTAKAGYLLGNFWEFCLASVFALFLGLVLGLYLALPN